MREKREIVLRVFLSLLVVFFFVGCASSPEIPYQPDPFLRDIKLGEHPRASADEQKIVNLFQKRIDRFAELEESILEKVNKIDSGWDKPDNWQKMKSDAFSFFMQSRTLINQGVDIYNNRDNPDFMRLARINYQLLMIFRQNIFDAILKGGK